MVIPRAPAALAARAKTFLRRSLAIAVLETSLTIRLEEQRSDARTIEVTDVRIPELALQISSYKAHALIDQFIHCLLGKHLGMV